MFLTINGSSEALDLEELAFIIILMPFIWLPIVLTGFNIRNLMKNNHTTIGIDMATIFIGGAYYIMLSSFIGDAVNGGITDKDYTKAVYPDQYHELLNSEYSVYVSNAVACGNNTGSDDMQL